MLHDYLFLSIHYVVLYVVATDVFFRLAKVTHYRLHVSAEHILAEYFIVVDGHLEQ